MATDPLARLDSDTEIREKLLTYCRLKPGEVWEDPVRGHRVGVLDVTCADGVSQIVERKSGCERLKRVCYTSDTDPIFAETIIRRLEHLRETCRTGFQLQNLFKEIDSGEVK